MFKMSAEVSVKEGRAWRPRGIASFFIIFLLVFSSFSIAVYPEFSEAANTVTEKEAGFETHTVFNQGENPLDLRAGQTLNYRSMDTPLSGYIAYLVYGDRISVIDPKNYLKIDDIWMSDIPQMMTIYDNGNMSLVTYENSKNLTVIDLRTNKVIKNIRLVSDDYSIIPTKAIYNPLAGKAFVISNFGLITVDLETGELSRMIDLSGTPTDICFSPDWQEAYITLKLRMTYRTLR